MNAHQASELGQQASSLLRAGQTQQAYHLLAPVLAQSIPFHLLRRIGEALGDGPPEAVHLFLDRMADDRSEGGWVVIGCALGRELDRDMKGALARCHRYIQAGDVWYAADILGERVPGPAFLIDFRLALHLLAPWREDANRWVRRAVGVSVHLWAKRSRGAPEHAAQAGALLSFLEPMFGEWEMDAVKGVGWGLKTLGKYYPAQATEWLIEQVAHQQRRHRSLMLHKALAHLSEEQRAQVAGATSGGNQPKNRRRE